MATAPLESWMFPEFEPVGVDLDSLTSVDAYDRNQGTDPARDDDLLDRLAVGPGTLVVDLGTGTGLLPVRAALRGAEAHAVDVSTNMLDFARRRAEDNGVTIIRHRAGFLTYRHEGPLADVVTTRSALHQLPDTWKQLALTNIVAMMRPGGLFYLWDAMWSFDPAQAADQLPAWVHKMGKPAGEGFTKEAFETHVREEFSTYGWIIEGMIQRAGLEIVRSDYPSPWYGEILAAKPDPGTGIGIDR